MFSNVRMIGTAFCIGLTWVAMEAPAFSHVSTSFTPPPHATSHAGGAAKGSGGFWRHLFNQPEVIVVTTGAEAPGAGYPVMADRPAQPILSDAERYRMATGLALPPRHGLIVVPPIEPKGDITYIWSNSGEN